MVAGPGSGPDIPPPQGWSEPLVQEFGEATALWSALVLLNLDGPQMSDVF
jgi:hypothetical protein